MVFILTLRIFLSALAGADGPERTAAIESLVATGDVDGIGQAVYREGWRERDGLIDALEKIGVDAVPVLVDLARHHPKVDGQRLAIRSLGFVGLVARDSLLALVAIKHRDLIVEALGRIGDKRDVPLVRSLLADGHPDVRRRAALALFSLAGKSAATDLAMLLDDAHHGVRFVAAEALVGLGDVGGQAIFDYFANLSIRGQFLALGVLGRLQYLPAKDLMMQVLLRDDWSLRSAAVLSLAVFNDSKSVLLAHAKHEKHPVVCVQLREVLAD